MTGIKIIAFLGSKSSGKSTAAKRLVCKHGFTRVRFAEPLKDMLIALGLDREHVDGPQALREEPLDILCEHSPRYAMQTLGTEWRDMLDKKLWARITRKRVSDLIAQGVTKIVIDDMRFPHEAEMFREIGCEIISIRRPDVEPGKWAIRIAHWRLLPGFIRHLFFIVMGWKMPHRSETEWFRTQPDIEIANTGNLDEFYSNIEEHALCSRE